MLLTSNITAALYSKSGIEKKSSSAIAEYSSSHFERVWLLSFLLDKLREVEEERKSPSNEQSSSSSPYLISDDPSPVPPADDASACSPAADSPHHDVPHYVPDYSEPVKNGLPSENAINSRLCTLL